MVATENGAFRGFVRLCQRSLTRLALAVLSLLKNALRPTTERSHRLVAMLLLASIAMLGLGAFVGTRLSASAVVTLCVVGGIGLLISGFAGTQLDATAHNARPGSGDFPVLRR